MQSRPTVIDLFSGVGGMSLGFEAAGFDIAAGVEIDPVHCCAHHFNFPYGVAICSDIRNVSKDLLYSALLEKEIGSIDVVVGGPPCQGFSQIGKRQLDDPRNQLVFEYLRLIDEIRPKYLVFENVPGIASGKHVAFLIELIQAFEGIGYQITQPYHILDASAFGVAQRRHRLILLGYREDAMPIKYPIPTHSDKSTKSLFEPIRKTVTASEAICDLEDFPIFVGDDEGLVLNNEAYTGYRKNFSFNYEGEYSLCHRRSIGEARIWGHTGSAHTQKSIARFDDTRPGETEKVSRFFRLHPDKPCNTLRAGTASNKGAFTAARPIHYSKSRCISIREAARLHSYPDWFQFHRTIWHGFREIGNSVAPLFAKKIAEVIIRALGINLSEIEIYDLPVQDSDLLTVNMSEAASIFGVPSDVIPTRKRLRKDVVGASHEQV